MTRSVMVCGGASYIGSRRCNELDRRGLKSVAFDNLSTDHSWAAKWGPLFEGDLLGKTSIHQALEQYRVDTVLHFAARSQVAESVADPRFYSSNNVTGTMHLLDVMRDAGIDRLVFSSTAAAYGLPSYTPIDEQHPTRPINPYCWSKLMAERLIAEYAQAYGLRAACLRYFNAAGADPDAETGEAHEPETQLIPNILRAALDPTAKLGTVFGNDYDTPDGTCIRDYIHVEDLSEAHLLAMKYLSRYEGHTYSISEPDAAVRWANFWPRAGRCMRKDLPQSWRISVGAIRQDLWRALKGKAGAGAGGQSNPWRRPLIAQAYDIISGWQVE